MKNHEKQSLIKFTLIYFFSIALLIILLGFLYFIQQKELILKKTTTEMFQYSQLVVKTDFKYTQNGFSYELKKNQKVAFEFPRKENDYYIKAFPISKQNGYIVVKTVSKSTDEEIKNLKIFTISLQIILLILLLIVSYYLAKKSLEPMKETISHLDRFIIDLIHDLNTPATAIGLNASLLLNKEDNEGKIKKLNRIKLSADTISSLYKNLELILEHKLLKEKIDLSEIISHKIDDFSLLYPQIEFINKISKNSFVISNEKALIRIFDNIISNACKYNNEKNPKIIISYEKSFLIIKDNGKGVKYPKKIFERNYKESQQGYGIGMHIVYRLCDNLDIKLDINSKYNDGTEVLLKFGEV